jgi:hypothetical protein
MVPRTGAAQPRMSDNDTPASDAEFNNFVVSDPSKFDGVTALDQLTRYEYERRRSCPDRQSTVIGRHDPGAEFEGRRISGAADYSAIYVRNHALAASPPSR